MQHMKTLQILLESSMGSKELVSKNIRRLRENRGLTQEALAAATGANAVTIRHYEYGRRFPRPEVLDAIATALRVDVSQLFTGEPAEDPLEESLKRLTGLLGYEIIKKP